jgi:tRNA-splicing ligase RtcB
MNLNLLQKKSDYEWHILPKHHMSVPGIIYASEKLLTNMDMKVYEQICNVASLPGIVKASYAMPDAHWGYGFPIGGVAAFDSDVGIISAGGVGFDISCGVRTLLTGLKRSDIESIKEPLAEKLFLNIPAGVGSKSAINLDSDEMNEMLRKGARWAITNGYGVEEDLSYIEEQGYMAGAKPEAVSIYAKERQKIEMGTLGSGNHYLEVQEVKEIFDEAIASAYGIYKGDILVSIHCGSRGLGHQIGTEFLRIMAVEAKKQNICLQERELAYAPLNSEIGQAYLGAMRAGINCAFANRQIITHLTRQVFSHFFQNTFLKLFYDVSHNTCKEEMHFIDGVERRLFVHRKGATRAFGPGHSDLPPAFSKVGQPVLIGGSMGTGSYILAGSEHSEEKSFGSSCHGAGRAMSRHSALRLWDGKEVLKNLSDKGIIIRSVSHRGVAEEAPGAYKDVSAVVDIAHHAGLSKKVAFLMPVICIKG